MKFKTSKSGNGPDFELINRLKNEFTDLIINFGTFQSLDDAYVSVQEEEEEYEEEEPQTTGEVIIRPMIVRLD